MDNLHQVIFTVQNLKISLCFKSQEI